MKPFPMPNDELRDLSVARGWCRVVASVEYRDEPTSIATVLLLFRETPFFAVAHYFLEDTPAEGDVPARQEDDLVVLARFENIVDAVEEYEQTGGDR